MPNKRELTGQRFGHLLVLKRLEEKQDKYYLWLCKCDCGNTTKVDTRRLVRGTITNCGCIPKKNARRGPVAEDLTGQKFGKLTVIRRAENKNGRTRWECQCDCGSTYIASAHELKRGKCKSCGCERHKKFKGIVDISGQRFGNLQVLYPVDKRNKKGSVCWKCRCDCGNEVVLSSDNLLHGNYRSCGCLRQKMWMDLPKRLHWVDGTCVEMLERRKHRSDNTSGFRGVYHMKDGKYRVTIGFKGKRYYIGTYSDYHDAIEERIKAENIIHRGFLNAYYKWKEKEGDVSAWPLENPLIFDVEKIDGQLIVKTNVDRKTEESGYLS